ncbi:hypothetical protein SAMN05428959_1011144 [Duganella sp. CF517]|uniref:hypothetical protein n=1 Tax=Duganella sp. CF517 TaxID=1881038 RepID=UPI0008C9017E|nr:hypothetical protein [Duganella sp. CF517]SEN31616.1 hypothetical protein SAMN05428959_1011144 [Duganella sp. CF517]
MSNGIDWFRWHHGSVTDPKFQLVARKAGASLPDVLAVWAFLLEAASAATPRGIYGQIDAEAVDCLFNFPDTETRTANIIAALEGRGMLADGRVVEWEKRQTKRERSDDSSTDRVAAHRARKAAATAVTEDETPCNASNASETPREEKSREEKEKKERKSKAESARASRLPLDWHPTEADTEFCKTERPDLRPSTVAAAFFDYWIAQPGAKGRKADWSATWRNWVRNEKLQPAPRASPGAPSDLAAAQRAANEEAKRRLGIAPGANNERIIDARE